MTVTRRSARCSRHSRPSGAEPRCSASPSPRTLRCSTERRRPFPGSRSACRRAGHPRTRSGCHFAEVHAPVADGELVRAAAPALARLVTGERALGTLRLDRLGRPAPASAPRAHRRRVAAPRGQNAPDGEDFGRSAWFRSERQTFVPIAGRAQAMFTIHVESVPLAEAAPRADARCACTTRFPA